MELIKLENDVAIVDEATCIKIAEYEKMMKDLKEKEEKIKQAILDEMEAKNVVKIENEFLTISYVASTERETLDTKKLREEEPEIYNNYIKFSEVKSSIRIKVK